MYTIDLLQGTGRPPAPRPLRVALVTIAFLLLLGGAVVMGMQYSEISADIGVYSQKLSEHQQALGSLLDAQQFLQRTAQDRQGLQSQLHEIGTVLGYQVAWSSLLTEISEVVPEDVTLSAIEVSRKEYTDADPNKVTYGYTLQVGALTPSDSNAVERFVEAVRTLKTEKPRLRSVRVAQQSRRTIHEHEFLYFDVECRVEP